jgi:excisionase family DNA binding protein
MPDNAMSAINVSNSEIPHPVMSLRQAASYLQVSKAHLSNVINGKVIGVRPIRSFRVGRRILIKRDWIDAWLEAQNSEPEPR